MRALLALLLSLPLASAPQEKGRKSLRIPVWLNGGNGATPALKAKDLAAKVSGAPARVLRAQGPTDDLMIVLVLDLTEDLSLVEIAKDALVEALAKLPANTHAGLMRAQDGLRVLVDPAQDRAQLIEAIRTLPVSGKAGLLETVETAARLGDAILRKAAVRAALLYVTDSSIYNYRDDYINPVVNYSDHGDLSRRFPEGLVKEKIARLERRLAVLETPLFIVHLNYRGDRLNEAYQTGLMQLASTLGGTSVFCRSRPEIPEAIGTAFGRIASAWRVDIQLPERPPKTIQVELESDGRALVYRNRFALEER